MSKNKYLDAIEYVSTSQTRMAVLKTFLVRGLCSAQHVETLSALSSKQVRSALTELSEPPMGLPACIGLCGEVFIQGQRGRPQKVFCINDAGKAILQNNRSGLNLHLPQFHDDADLLHSFTEMEIYCAGFSQNKKLAIERRLDYGSDGNFIIPDLLLLENQRVIFEVEQQARRAHQLRIEEKLSRLFQFFLSSQSRNVSKEVRLIFTTTVDHNRTLETWQAAILQVQATLGNMPFHLYWVMLEDFLKNPEWGGIENFRLLEAHQPVVLPVSAHTPEVVEPVRDQVNMTALEEVVSRWADEFPQYRSGNPVLEGHKMRLRSFFEIMNTIYEASHYMCGPTAEYAVFPSESISLLNRYLLLPQNGELLARLKRQVKKIQTNHERVMLARIEIGKLCWAFVEHHSLSRGGSFKINIIPPDFNSGDSDFIIEVRMYNLANVLGKKYFIGDVMGGMQPEEKALAWVLTALYLYADRLGLGEEKPVIQSNKRTDQ